MGQGYSLTTLSAGSAGIDIPELSDLVYEKSLGSARFMKSIRARHRNGLVFIKVIMKPYPSMDLGPYVRELARERSSLAGIPNTLGYQRIIETSTSGYLARQYIHSSLYDRLSTRPFLERIEKKWIAFQLLCALRDCHAQDLFHGDIKTENILVTSWNWLYLTDFSSSFKPTFLPEDNPADFSFYFDTSGRRTCYLAPERFLAAGEKPGKHGVDWAMDIFSAGCVIAELFLEAPVFTLSQLFRYRKGEYDLEHMHLSKIEDPEIRDLVAHMVKVDPESRYSAQECLNFWRRKAFPEYFYSFLHQYMGLITDPTLGRPLDDVSDIIKEADERIGRIHLDFDKISYFLGSNAKETVDGSQLTSSRLTNWLFPLQLDIPNCNQQVAKSRSTADNGTLIFLALVVSSIRSTAKASTRVKACDILLAFAERVTDEAKLDRILPYVMLLLEDRSDMVKAIAIQTLAQLLSMVKVISPVNTYIFPEYIFRRLQPFIYDHGQVPSPVVRAAYASCIASIAHSSVRFLDTAQTLRSDERLHALTPASDEAGWNVEVSYHNLYDVARRDLLDFFEGHTKALITDSDVSVRRAFLGSVSSLCVFFGNLKANEVILSHLNTYLNDKDWMLKCTFFETVVGVAAYVGSTSLEEFILPLMVQSITDPEEFVVERVFRSLASMAKLGLFQRSTTWDLLDIAVRFFVHPSSWIREAAVHFVVASTEFLSVADKYSIISPLIRPFLRTTTTDISETQILDTLKRPLPKNVYDMTLAWASKTEKGIFWKSTSGDIFNLGDPNTSGIGKLISRGTRTAFNAVSTNAEDEQWLSRLRTVGMIQEDEFKLLALKEYLFRVAHRSKEDYSNLSGFSSWIKLSEHNVTPQTVTFDRSLEPHPSRPTRRKKDTKPHTITDALLDASTTVDSNVGGHRHNRSQSARLTNNSGGADSSRAVSGSPGTASPQPDMQDLPIPSDGRKYAPDSALSSPRTTASDRMHRSSAMNLLNRHDSSKTAAATATTTSTALGQVESQPSQTPRPSPMPTPTDRKTYRMVHTYEGNDPTILRLLEAVFTDNYPSDMHDFGPPVTPVSLNSPLKRVSGQSSDKPWRPQGILVAMFSEHGGPINRVVIAPDHNFFATASDDGTVKVWDTSRLEKNVTPRSRATYHHAPGTKIKALTFVEDTHTFVSAATDGSVHAVRIERVNMSDAIRYRRPRAVREYSISETSKRADEYAVWLEHFRMENHSVLLIATNKSRVIALDLKSMTPLYILSNPVHHGTPTTFCLDTKHNWLLLGTSHGILDLWDLRFQIRVKGWGIRGGTPIHRILHNPQRGRGRQVCVSGGSARSAEITVWDIDKMQCLEVYRTAHPSPSPPPPTTTVPSSHRNLHLAPDTTLAEYAPWPIDDDKPEAMLARFAADPDTLSLNLPPDKPLGQSPPPDTGSTRNAITAIAAGAGAGLSAGSGSGSNVRSGFLISGGYDRKLRLWDMAHAEMSTLYSVGPEADSEDAHVRARYEIVQAHGPVQAQSRGAHGGGEHSSAMTVTTEWLSTPSTGEQRVGRDRVKSRSRSSVVSLRSQRLLRSHLDAILDVAILRVPYAMTISVDRSGIIYVFQ